jgi:NADPH-dependent 2,4-dienoyl-CoA reductase/sulfur reductase-like enzyme
MLLTGCKDNSRVYDISVYGGTSSGVIAAYYSAMVGKKVILVEPGRHYHEFENWTFEPHVAENIFNDYIQSAGVKVLFNSELTGVDKENTRIYDIKICLRGNNSPEEIIIKASEFIDCSCEGDLMARAGKIFMKKNE